MKRKINQQFVAGIIFLVIFIVYTLSLLYVDIQPVGPKGSSVAYATINKSVHSLLGVNMVLYTITDWAGLLVMFIPVGFAIMGLCQWIKRKSIFKVDGSILLLGRFYVVLFFAYLFFEINVINYRPVLINGILEASYPSSTTMLAMCILPTTAIKLKTMIKNHKIRKSLSFLCYFLTVFMVICRVFSGVHWATDILGGIIYSTAMVLIYSSLNNLIYTNKKADDR